jgi:hypothetical protein
MVHAQGCPLPWQYLTCLQDPTKPVSQRGDRADQYSEVLDSNLDRDRIYPDRFFCSSQYITATSGTSSCSMSLLVLQESFIVQF